VKQGDVVSDWERAVES